MKQLSEEECLRLYEAQGPEVETKVALADLELNYERQRQLLMAAIEQAVEAKERAFEAVVRSHGLDPREWRPNIATQMIEPYAGMVQPSVEPDHFIPGSFVPIVPEEEMDRRRGRAVSVRMMEEDDV
jgi:hypothetical protein